MKWSVSNVAYFLNGQDDESIRRMSNLFQNQVYIVILLYFDFF